MLGKLAYRNTKRNIKDYLIYLITVTASFSLIFAFNLVANSDEIVKLCSSMDAFKNSLFAVNILIIFVICFLINYTTKFMFEKRSKELGTYMLLGIKKKEIAHLVVIENILLGILAIVLAIPIGFLFSQFVSLVIVNLLGIPKTLFISLNFVSIGLLIIYFLTIYVLVLLNLLRRISKMTIRDFLYFDKQNEKKMFRDSKKRNVIFVLSIILGVISLFLWNSRCTMDNFNKQETLTCLMVSVIMLIISIYGISTTCADMFLTVLLKNKKMKYQNDNLFVARTFASKARTMSFTFGTLSMLILTSLLALNYSSINKASYDISVNLNAPYDIQLFDDMERKAIINIHDIENVIYTDEKWLTFILSQIVQNAIKYFDKQENKLTIYSQDNGTNILLVVEDNGCGIKASDLSRVFEKGFTGSNRNKANATGMGLYLSKKLCDRLGLKLDIASTEKEYTRLTITFPKGTVHNFSE